MLHSTGQLTSSLLLYHATSSRNPRSFKQRHLLKISQYYYLISGEQATKHKEKMLIISNLLQGKRRIVPSRAFEYRKKRL